MKNDFKSAKKHLEARYDISFADFDNAIISSGGAQLSRLICKNSAGKSARLDDDDVALLAVRHIHSGNMYHPPADDTEILYQK